MAIAIRGTTPVTGSATASSTVSVTCTGTQQPQAGDVLLIIHGNDFYAATAMPTPTVGGSTTGVNAVTNGSTDAGTNEAHVKSYTFVVGSTGDLTVSVTESAPGDEEKDLVVYVLSGVDTTTPVDVAGGQNGGSVATTSPTAPSVSPTSSDAFLICYTNSGGGTISTPYTPPSGMTEDCDFSVGGAMGVSSAHLQLSASGATGTKAFTAGNAPYGAISVAMKTAAGSAGILGSTPQVVPQQLTRTPVAPIVQAPTMGPPQVLRLPPIAVARHVKQPPEFFPIAFNPPFLPAQVRPVAPIVVAPQSRPPQPSTVVVSQPQIPAAVAVGILPLTVTVVAQQFRPPSVLPVVITPPSLPQAPAPIVVVPSRPQGPLVASIVLIPPPLPQPLAPIVVLSSTWRPNQPQISLSLPAFLPAPTPVLAPAPILVAPAFRVEPQWPPMVLTPSLLVAAICITPRPSTGTTARPGTGTTAYALATTARPSSGTTTRPNTGTTVDPC